MPRLIHDGPFRLPLPDCRRDETDAQGVGGELGSAEGPGEPQGDNGRIPDVLRRIVPCRCSQEHPHDLNGGRVLLPWGGAMLPAIPTQGLLHEESFGGGRYPLSSMRCGDGGEDLFDRRGGGPAVGQAGHVGGEDLRQRREGG